MQEQGKRLMLTVALALGVILVWNWVFHKEEPPPSPTSGSASGSASGSSSPSSSPSSPASLANLTHVGPADAAGAPTQPAGAAA